MAIDQSRTQWNPAKKNAAGKVIQKGYLSQYGKPEKRITGTVALKQAASGVAAGGQRSYVKGRAGATAKPTAARKSTSGSTQRGSSPQTSNSSNNTSQLTQAEKNRLAAKTKALAEQKRMKDIQANGPSKNKPMSAQGKRLTDAWALQDAYMKKKTGAKVADDKPSSNPVASALRWLDRGGKDPKEIKIVRLNNKIRMKQKEAAALKANKDKNAAEVARQKQLDAEIKRLKSQL